MLDSDPVDTARERVSAVAATTLQAAGVDSPQQGASILEVEHRPRSARRADRSPHELRADTQLAWRSFFSSLATESPAVVVVEDLQWADAAVLEVLEDVTTRANGPLLLLTTARPELTDRRPTWGAGLRRFTGLVVEPLATEESKRLVDLLVDPGTSSADRKVMLHRAEGNPFFLEEIVRTRALGSADSIPDTVQAALAARIDLLQRDEKRLLQAAAVVGRVFWPAAVAEVATLDPTTVDELLDDLQDRDLVLGRLASSMSGQREMIFKHALIRDVAYESLPRRERVRMHTDVADWIEQAFAGRRDEVVELIAHHRAVCARGRPDARDPGRRVRSGRRRGRERLRARRLRAGALLRARGAGTREHPARAGPRARGARLRLVRALRRHHRVGVAARGRGHRARRDPGRQARLARICGFGVMIPARAQGLLRFAIGAEEVRPYLDLGLEAAGEEPSEALALLCVAQGLWDFGFGIDPEDPDGVRAQRAAERARELAQQLGRPDLELMSLDALTAGWQMRGLYGLAEAANRERLEIARTVSDPFEVSDTYYTAAWAKLDIGRYEDVVALTDEFIARDTDVEPIGQLSLSAVARLALGDWDGALADQARVRELIGEEAAVPRFSTSGYGVETLIHEARGDRAAADAVLAEIWAGMEATESTRDWSLPPGRPWRWRAGATSTQAASMLDRVSVLGVYLPRELEARCVLDGRAGRLGRGPGPRRACAPPRRGRRPARAAMSCRPAGGPRAAGDRRRGGRGGVALPGARGIRRAGGRLGGRAHGAVAGRGARPARPRRRGTRRRSRAAPRSSSAWACRASSNAHGRCCAKRPREPAARQPSTRGTPRSGARTGRAR